MADLSPMQKAIVEVLEESDRGLTPKEVSSRTPYEHQSVRAEMPRMYRSGLIKRPYKGIYTSRTRELNEPSEESESYTPGNFGIIVTDKDSGRVWWRIRFPDWMEVVTPARVVIGAKIDAIDTESQTEAR